MKLESVRLTTKREVYQSFFWRSNISQMHLSPDKLEEKQKFVKVLDNFISKSISLNPKSVLVYIPVFRNERLLKKFGSRYKNDGKRIRELNFVEANKKRISLFVREKIVELIEQTEKEFNNMREVKGNFSIEIIPRIVFEIKGGEVIFVAEIKHTFLCVYPFRIDINDMFLPSL